MAKLLTFSSSSSAICNPIAERARELRDAGALVLDTETTGSAHEDEIIELGIVRALDGERLIDARYKPQVQINIGAYNVHKISGAMLAGKPKIAEHWEKIVGLMEGKAVLAWNSSYDSRLLEQTAERYSLPLPSCEWICAMKMYKEFRRLKSNTSLTDACEAMGVKPGDHSAVNDALAAARVIFKMAESVNNAGKLEQAVSSPSRRSWAQEEIDHEADETALTVAEFLLSFGWQEEKRVREGDRIISAWTDPIDGKSCGVPLAVERQRARMIRKADSGLHIAAD